MNLSEFQRLAMSGAAHSIDRDVSYFALGLCGECGELLELSDIEANHDDAKDISELGDALWYVAAVAMAAGITLDDSDIESEAAFGLESFAAGMAMYAGLIANKVKKSIRDRVPLDSNFVRAQLREIICLIRDYADVLRFPYVDQSTSRLPVGLSGVMEGNLAKIAAKREQVLRELNAVA